MEQAIAVAANKAFVILDGTLLRIDRVGMTGGYDRAYYSGKPRAAPMSWRAPWTAAGLAALAAVPGC